MGCQHNLFVIAEKALIGLIVFVEQCGDCKGGRQPLLQVQEVINETSIAYFCQCEKAVHVFYDCIFGGKRH